MKKIPAISMISLFMILLTVCHAYTADDNSRFPEWINKLHANINQTFQQQAKVSHVKEPDDIEQNEFFSFSIKGTGFLTQTPDPFGKMHQLFLSDGWKRNERYDADGHGSSSFAYEKGKHLCVISVETDSSCNDEEEGHVPSEFWFDIYCREKSKNQLE